MLTKLAVLTLLAVHAVHAQVATFTAYANGNVSAEANGNAGVNAIAHANVNAAVGNSTKTSKVLTVTAAHAAYENSFSVGERVVLGDAANYSIATPCKAQSWTITNSTAAAIALEFASVSLAKGDKLTITGASTSGSVSASTSPSNASSLFEITSSSADGITTPAVNGKAIQLTYQPSDACDASAKPTTFQLAALSVRYSRKFLPQKEAVCGVDTMKNAKCFLSGGTLDKQMYQKSQAVLRTMRTRGDGLITVCTAWLWGNKGHMITNNHCFSSQDMVDATEFHFGVETTSCSSTCDPNTCTVATIVVGKGNVKFIKSNDIIDVALLQITSGADAILKRYGYLQARYGHPEIGEAIYIPQHPGGGPLMIANTDDDAGTKVGRVQSLDLSATTDGKTFTGLLGYSLDTESGSSGSPVLSATNHVVVGLHRIGMCENAATPVNKLLPFIVPLAGDNNGFVVQ